jgi:hypothetical protein
MREPEWARCPLGADTDDLPQGVDGRGAMASWIAVLLATGLLTATPCHCVAQETQELPDGAATREQWQQRVEAARRRSEDFVANARTQTPPPPSPDALETEAADRVVNDPTLRQGDIVSTGRGFFVFVGRDEEHRSSDFQPIPKRNNPR